MPGEAGCGESAEEAGDVEYAAADLHLTVAALRVGEVLHVQVE